MSEGELLRVGKVKEVYSTKDPDILEFLFTDKISVFDKIIPSLIPGKGESLCRTASYWFEKATDLGVGTHYIDRPEGKRMRVKRVNVIQDLDLLTSDTTNYLIPLEAICRYFLAGSLHDRVMKGKVPVEDLGFSLGHVPKYGERLPEPWFEVTTKFERFDRRISKEEALGLSGLLEHEYENLRDNVLKVDRFIENEVEKRGLLHVDGKKEFAFDDERRMILVDTFGTADEDRFWDKTPWQENGECVELSKELVRKYYRDSGYLEKLESAREAKVEEPPIPALESGFIGEVKDLYIGLFTRLTGQRF